MAKLNAQQRLAVEHGSGPALVLAGAGSGKTRVIAHRIAYLIQNGAARPENILAVTFTNKAAQEMRERVHALLGPSRTAEPLITTFHSLCVRVLRREIQRLGYKRDFSIYDTDDQRRLMKQILENERRTEKDLAPREILGRISYAKNHNITVADFAARFPSETAEDLQHLYKVYDERLRKSNALDFDDLLLKTTELLERFPEVRDNYSHWYRYILVDEYQDTNRTQYDLLRLLTARHKNVFVVGDEDQSIYKFRGANIQNILNFERDFPGATTIKLEQNYRSTQTILDVAGAVVSNNTERKGKVLWTENARGDVATCHRSPSARAEAEWVAFRIQDMLQDNPDCHIAILYRTNALSRNFEDVLIQRGIAYVVVGSVGFFNRMEVKDMLAYLRVIYNPEDDVALLRIINTPPRGIGSTTVEQLTTTAVDKGVPVSQVVRELVKDPQRAGRAHRALARFQELLDAWISNAEQTPAGKLLEEIVNQIGYLNMLEERETPQEAESRIANVEELVRAAYESEERGETIFEFLDRASLSSELDQFDPNARVALLTVHSAKGLEFDVVLLAGMEEGLFPHFQSRDSKEDLEEERRLCYVGMTRARGKLYLTWTPYRRSFGPEAGMPSLPSRFLKEIPEALVEGFDTQAGYVFEESGDYQDEEEEEDDATEERAGVDAGSQPRSLAELRAYVEKQNSGKSGGGAGPVLKPGMRVRHAQFGDGIILSRQRTGNDVKLTITFGRVGRKTLIERYAKLRPL
ncbi:MAG: UvrD-helicase domain-containing protein [Acidobacteriia bacterium]|nr:UvrD-helicase domain-containing protein [Terriglobia bacterium]